MTPALQQRRLRGKQPPPDVRIKKDPAAVKKVYLVTAPHPHKRTLKRLRGKTSQPAFSIARPADFDRADIEKAFLDAAARPVYADSRNRHQQVKVDLERMAIFLELHKSKGQGPSGSQRMPHYHVALQATRSFRFAPLKLALRQRYGLATDWSCTHDGYWSALRYGAFPSPKKPRSELDPQPRLWAKSGAHPALLEACEEPVTVAATRQRRLNAAMAAAEKGKPAPRPTEMDLYAVIVDKGFRNTPDDQHACKKLIAYLKESSPSLFAFAFKIRAKLGGLIDDVWSWETVGDTLSVVTLPRVARLQHAASQPCICAGAWRTQADRIFTNNGLDPSDFCTDVHRALFQGRGPSTQVLVLAGRFGGEGKSYLLAPLRGVYGSEQVQESPQPGSFPLLGIEDKNVALLDEWRFDESVLRMATQLLWYEGKPFPVTRPQNQAGTVGHFLYRGGAPLFVTTKEEWLEQIEAAAEQARITNQATQHTMLLRRLKIYKLHKPTPVPGDCTIPECPACFAGMVLSHSRDRRGLDGATPASTPTCGSTFLWGGIDPADL